VRSVLVVVVLLLLVEVFGSRARSAVGSTSTCTVPRGAFLCAKVRGSLADGAWGEGGEKQAPATARWRGKDAKW
jgi:hypothetical protein